MRTPLALVIVIASACSDPAPVERTPPPACRTDGDCEVVDVPCVGTAALPRALAAQRRAEWEREGAEQRCARAPGAPEVRLAAYCAEATCRLDRIVWPDLRACTADAECTAVADPCGGSIGVRAEHENAARARLAARRCPSEDPTAGLAEVLGPGAPPAGPRCERGACRAGE